MPTPRERAPADVLSVESTVTIRGQTTIPQPIRRALKLNPADKVRFSLRGDDTVVITRVSTEHGDPMVAAFLDFIEADARLHPQRVRAIPVDLIDRARELSSRDAGRRVTVGVDTGVLVAITVREHPVHAAAWRWFTDEVRGRDGAMALAPQVLAEYAHVVTDPRRFASPLSMGDALALASRWWHARECRQVAAEGDAVAIFLDWMAEHRLGRIRLADALMAASYRAAGVARLATTAGRDFDVFGGFEVVRIGG